MVTIDYFGMSGSGRTVTEAKQNAGRAIKAALDGSYTPEIIAWRGTGMLVHREPNGWCYRIITEPDGSTREGPVYGCPNDKDKAAALLAASRHLADQGMRETDTEPPEFLKDRESRGEFMYKLEFLRRYRKAQRAGMNDNDAHSYAGRNPARPELQALVPEGA